VSSPGTAIAIIYDFFTKYRLCRHISILVAQAPLEPSELALRLSKGASEGITALAGELGAEPPRVSFATFLASARKVEEELPWRKKSELS